MQRDSWAHSKWKLTYIPLKGYLFINYQPSHLSLQHMKSLIKDNLSIKSKSMECIT
jgi:hypothetical protein